MNCVQCVCVSVCVCVFIYAWVQQGCSWGRHSGTMTEWGRPAAEWHAHHVHLSLTHTHKHTHTHTDTYTEDITLTYINFLRHKTGLHPIYIMGTFSSSHNLSVETNILRSSQHQQYRDIKHPHTHTHTPRHVPEYVSLDNVDAIGCETLPLSQTAQRRECV